MKMSTKKRKMLKVALLAALSAGIVTGAAEKASAYFLWWGDEWDYNTDKGTDCTADGDWASAYGYSGYTSGYGATGYGADSDGYGAALSYLGFRLYMSNATRAVGVGSYLKTYSSYVTALGADSYIGSNAEYSVALGYGSRIEDDQKTIISVGSGKSEDADTYQYRRITNVADGKNAHDAVTVGQLEDYGLAVDGVTAVKGQVFTLNADPVITENSEFDHTGNVANVVNKKGETLIKLNIENGVISHLDTTNKGYVSGEYMYNELRAPIAVKYNGAFEKYKNLSTPYISNQWKTGDNLKTLAWEVKDLDDHFDWSDGKATNDSKSQWIWGGFQESGYTVKGTKTAAYGINNKAEGNYMTAVGNENADYGARSTAVGSQNVSGKKGGANTSDTSDTTAVGSQNYATGSYSSAYGYSNEAYGENATAIGSQSKAEFLNATAVGANNTASSEQSSAFGYSNTASGTRATAIGTSSTAEQDDTTAVGSSVHATNSYAAAYGYNSTASGESSIAIGNTATASNTSAIAIGTNATTAGSQAVAIGAGTSAAGLNSIALGVNSKTLDTEENVVSIGGIQTDGTLLTRRIINVSDGVNYQDAATVNQLPRANQTKTFNSKTTRNIIITNSGSTIADITIAVGEIKKGSTGFVDGDSVYKYITDNASAIVDFNHGYSDDNDHWLSTDYGETVTKKGKDSTAYGYNANAQAQNSVAIGYGAVVNADAVGANAGAIALGADSVVSADDGNVLSIGGAMVEDPVTGEVSKLTRRITNVAAGENTTDAANWGQILANQNVSVSAQNNTAKLYDNEGNELITITVNDLGGADGTTSIVNYSTSDHWLSTDFGKEFTKKGKDSTAYGYGANAQADNSVAIGAGSVATEVNTFSVGSTDNTRRIVNVAAGENNTDAANVGQLIGVQSIDADNNVIKDRNGNTLVTITGLGGSGSGSGDGSGIVDYNLSYASAADNTQHWLSTDFGKKKETVHGNNSAAYGYKANATSTDAVAIGTNALAKGAKTVAMGAESVASGLDENGDQLKDSDGNFLREVSFGHKAGDIAADGTVYGTDLKSKLTNIAYGEGNNDVATVGQILADGQTLSLASTIKPETGDDTRTNVLRANDGTVLAALEKGELARENAGFVSGGDVWAVSVKAKQSITPTENIIYANDGTELATIAVADPDKDDNYNANTFITKNYYDKRTSQYIKDNSIVDFDKTSKWLSTDFGATVANHGISSTAYGYQARAAGDNSVALGTKTQANAINTVAIGNTARADYEGSIAIGAESRTYGADEVSFGAGQGSNATTRRLTHVAAGDANTDAANVGQLVSSKVVSFAKTEEPAEGEEDKRTNVLTTNDGTVLVEFEKGDVDAGSIGFVSGGEVYNADVQKNQTLSANNTEILNNNGDKLFDIEVASSDQTNKNGSGFVTEKYYYDTVNNLIQSQSIVNYDSNYAENGNYWLSTDFGDKDVYHGANSTAYGYKANAKKDNSVAIGYGSIATEENTFSVGSSANARRIVNVAAGTSATDAVNLGQIIKVGGNSTVDSDGVVKLTNAAGDTIYTIKGIGSSSSSGGSSVVTYDSTIGAIYTDKPSSVRHGEYSTTYGFNSVAKEKYSVAIGAGSVADAERTFSVGGATIDDLPMEKDGIKVYYTGDNQATGTIVYKKADGTYVTEGVSGEEVSWSGDTSTLKEYLAEGTLTRRITNVSDGTADTDAATVGQLKTIEKAVKNLTITGGSVVEADKSKHYLATSSYFDQTVSAGQNSTAYGYLANATRDQATAIGYNAKANAEKSVALGAGSVVTEKEGNVISVGSTADNLTRKIINVAKGEALTDAATLAQVAKTGQDVNLGSTTKTVNGVTISANQIASNDGTVLATFTKGTVESDDTGFVSGGDVWLSDVREGQTLTATSTEIKNNNDEGLFSIKAASTEKTDEDNEGSFITKEYYDETLKEIIYKDSIVDYEKDYATAADPDHWLSTDFGQEKVEHGKDSAAYGYGANAKGENSVALGKEAKSYEENAVAIGNGAEATKEGSVAIGSGADAKFAGSVAIGQDSVTAAENTVSFGDADFGLSRKLTNVAKGETTGEAATYEQIVMAGQDVKALTTSREGGKGNYNEIIANDGKTSLATFAIGSVADDDYGFISGDTLYTEVRPTAALSSLESEDDTFHYIATEYSAAQNLVNLDYQVYTNSLDIDGLKDLSNLTDVGQKKIIEKAAEAVKIEAGNGIIVKGGTPDADTGIVTYKIIADGGISSDSTIKTQRFSNLLFANSVNLLGNNLSANNKSEYEENLDDTTDTAKNLFSSSRTVSTFDYGQVWKTVDPNGLSPQLEDTGEYSEWIRDQSGGASFAVGTFVLATADKSAVFGESSRADGLYSIALGADSVATEAGEVSFGHDVGDINQRASILASTLTGEDNALTAGKVTYEKALNRRLTHVSAGYNDTDVVNFSQIKTVAPTYTGDNVGTTYLTSSLDADNALNDKGTVGKNLAALDAKAVKSGQSLNFSSTSTSGTLYSNDGTALATIEVTGLTDPSGKGSFIVDYDPDYANTDEEGHSRWLSTDFDKTGVTHGTDSTAYGYGANAKGDESVAIGKNAYAEGEGSIAIGADSVAHTTTDEQGNKIEEISFGHTTDDIDPSTITDANPNGTKYTSDLKRKLTNVAYGTDDNDVATYGQTVAGGQAVTLSTAARDTGDAKKGKGNEIVANDGTVLATFDGMTSVSTQDNGFVSGAQLYAENRNDITDTNYLSNENTTGANLNALATKIGGQIAVTGLYAEGDNLETKISKVAEARIASEQTVSFEDGKNVITDAAKTPNTLVTFKKGKVSTGSDGFVSGGQVWDADVATATVNLSDGGNKVYTNSDKSNALLTFTGMTSVAANDYGFVSGANLYAENRNDIVSRKDSYISKGNTTGANLSALDAKAIYVQTQEVDDDGTVSIYSNDGSALFTITGIQGGSDSSMAGGEGTRPRALQTASLMSFINNISLADLNDSLQESNAVLTAEETPKYADSIFDDIFTYGSKGSSDDGFADRAFSNAKNKSSSNVRNDIQGYGSVSDGGLLNVASGEYAAVYGYATYAGGQNSAAFGHASVANSDNEVSFGHSTGDIDLETMYWDAHDGVANKLATFDSDLTRRLTHVSAGYNDTDVVNFSQIKTVAPTYTAANAGTTYLTSSLNTDTTLNEAGTVGKNLAALDAKAVKSGQSLSFSSTSTSGTLYSNDGTALATIKVTGLGESSGKGSSIVDYDPDYAKASTEAEKHSGWLSTDFDKDNVTHGTDSTAYGYGANAKGDESVAIGKDAIATEEGSVAIGAGATSKDGSVAIGDGAYAQKNSVAIGQDSVAYGENELSFGHKSDDVNLETGDKYGTDLTRKLTNVTYGTEVNDVATFGQIVAEDQLVKLSATNRSDNVADGKYNELVANDGTVLATFQGAEVKSGDTGFVSGGDLYTEVRTKDGTYVQSTQTTKENLEALDAAIVSSGKVIHQDTNNIIKIGDELGGKELDVSGKDGTTTIERVITGVADGTKAGDAATWDQIAAANQVLYATASTEYRENNRAGNVLYDNMGNALATLTIGSVTEDNAGFVSGGQVWSNDIASGSYKVDYNGTEGSVTLRRNGEEEGKGSITIYGIKTSIAEGEETDPITAYVGDNSTIRVNGNTISAVTSKLTDDQKKGLATVEDVYDYLAPKDGSDLVSKDKTTGENLAALGSAVQTNADAITNLQNMTNISPEGETVIKKYAQDAVKVAGSENVTVTSDTDTEGALVYTVAAKTGEVGDGKTTLVTGGDVQTAIDKALEEIIGGDGSTGTLSSKANLDASNIGRNVAGADSLTAATEAEKNQNMTAWGEALGDTKVTKDSKHLITSGAVYDELRPTADGTIVEADKTVAENLAALDEAVANSSSVINKAGDTIYIGKDTTDKVINVAGKDGKDGQDGKTIERVITGVAEGDSDGDVATWNQIAAKGQTLYATDSTTVRNTEGRAFNTAGNVLYDNDGNALATLYLGSVSENNTGFVSGGQVWANDVASGTYTVDYNDADNGTVRIRKNSDPEGKGSIIINGIKTTVNPNITGIDSYNGSDYINVDGDTIYANTGELSNPNAGGLATVADVYNYVTPTDEDGNTGGGNYVSGGQTTGENLYALDTQVKSNADAITKLQDMEDISDKGTTVIQNISKEAAKNAVKVAQGSSGYVTVEGAEGTDGNMTYTVDVKRGSVANGGTGFVDGQDVYDELRPTDGTYVKKINSTALNLNNLDDQMKVNTTNITNLQNMTDITDTGKDQIRDLAQGSVIVNGAKNVTVVSEEKDNVLTYTVSAEGKGQIEASNDALLTGGTAYTYLAPTSGKYVSGNQSTGKNLSALDAEIVKLQNMETVTTTGEKTIREIVSKSVEVKAGDNSITVVGETNEATGVTTFTLSKAGGGEGGSSIVDYDGIDHWLSTDFGKQNVSHGKDSTAYGYGANAQGDESVAIGKDAIATDEGSVAIGAGAEAEDGSVAIGEGAKAQNNSIAIGKDSVAYGTNEISFGHSADDTNPETGKPYGSALTRKLTNVEYGTENNDVATVGQTVADGQTVTLASTVKPATGTDTRTNVLRANDGTVLAEFAAGSVKKDNTGFISGGDLYSEVRVGDGYQYVNSLNTTAQNLIALDEAIQDSNKLIHQDENDADIIKIGDELEGTKLDISGKDGKDGTTIERVITGVAEGGKDGEAATWNQIAAKNQMLYATEDTSHRGGEYKGNVLYDNMGNTLATLTIGEVAQDNTGFVSGGQVWANDMTSGSYKVEYTGDTGKVVLKKNNGSEIIITNIRTTLDPDAAEAVTQYSGDGKTITVDGGTISAKKGEIAPNSEGLVTGADIYAYVAPTNENGLIQGGTYVERGKTAGENLYKLDTQVATNADAITNLQNMTNISQEGKTVIKNYAKDAVKVEAGDYVNVSDSLDSDGNKIYTVSAKVGSVAAGDTGLVTGDDVQTAIDKALEEIIGGDGSTGTLSSKANLDASNIGKNLKSADGTSEATAAEKTANLNAWGEALGGGTVDANSKQLITGETLYNEVRPADGTVVGAGKTVAENLAALDEAVANSSSVINKAGDTIYIGKDTTDTVINVAGKDGKDGTTTIERVITGVAEGDSDGDAATWNQIAAKGQKLYATDSTTARGSEQTFTTAGNVLYDNMGNALATLTLGSVSENNTGFVSGGQVWANDVASGTYTVDYNDADNGTVRIRKNSDPEGKGSIIINGIKTTVNPNITGIDSYNGSDYIDIDGDTIYANTGELSKPNAGGLATVADVYNYVTPTNEAGDKVDGEYAKANKTTGENLYALDTQVKSNADAITKLQDMEDISDKGTTVIQNISKEAAKNAVKVAGTGYATVTDATDADGNVTYTVDVAKGSVASGSQGLVSGGDVYSYVTPTKGTYVSKDKTAGENISALDTQVKANADDITKLQDMSGITESGTKVIKETAQEAIQLVEGDNVKIQKTSDDNENAIITISAKGEGTIGQNESRLVTGGTIYDEVRPEVGTYVKANQTTGKNLESLDSEIVKIQNMQNITDGGKSEIKKIAGDAVKVAAGDGVFVDTNTDETSGVTTYTISSTGGTGGSSIVNYDANTHWLSTDFGKQNVSHGEESTAYGYGANAKGDESVAIGHNAYAEGDGSIAIGSDSVAKTVTNEDGSTTAEISFGHSASDINPETGKVYGSALTRKLTNVEYGTENNDVATVGQTVAGHQVISLEATAEPEADEEDTRTNILKANDGTVLATFAAGAVVKNNKGFVSGGDVWLADIAENQTISAAVGQNVIKNNAGKTLVTFKVADPNDPNADPDAFVTKNYYDETINNIVNENSIVDYDKDYATAEDSNHWLSTDFGATDVDHGKDSTAYGYGANAKGDESVAIGKGATATDEGSVAIGAGAVAEDGSVAIGEGAKAQNNSIAIGKDSVAYGTNEISFGHKSDDINPETGDTYNTTVTRKLTNVQYGTDENDVATFGQVTAEGQSVKLSHDARNKDNAKAGHYDELVANDGTVLATFERAEVAADNAGFVSGGDLYSEVRPTSGSVVSSTKTTAQNLEALDEAVSSTTKVIHKEGDVIKIGDDLGGTTVSVAGKDGKDGKTIERVITGVAEGDSVGDAATWNQIAASNQTLYASSSTTLRKNEDRASSAGNVLYDNMGNTLATLSVGSVSKGSNGFVSGDTVWQNDIKARDYSVVYNGEVGEIVLERNNGETITIGNIRTTLDPNAGEAIDNYDGDNATVTVTKKDGVGIISAVTGELDGATKSGLATVADVYEYLTPTNAAGEQEDGGIVKNEYTTGENLYKLDTQVVNNTLEIEKLQDMEGLSDKGTTIIKNISQEAAKKAVTVVEGDNIKVDTDDDGYGNKIYTVSAKTGSVAAGDTGLVTGDDVQTAIDKALEEIIGGDGSTGTLSSKANLDASNIGKNLKSADGTSEATAAEKTANLNAWGEALGGGTVDANSKQLITGETLYNEVRPADGTVVGADKTVAENLAALDEAVANSSSVINKAGDTIYIGKDTTDTVINVAGKDGRDGHDGETIERVITGVAEGDSDGDVATWNQIAAANQVLYATASTEYRENNRAGNVLYDNMGNALATLTIGSVTEDNAGFVSGGQVWSNDIASGSYKVDYNGTEGSVTLRRNGEEEGKGSITIYGIKTSIAEGEETDPITAYVGDNSTIKVKGDTISAVTGEMKSENKAGLATVKDVYDYVSPTNESGKPADGTIAKTYQTTGENLYALDTQVTTNTNTIKELQENSTTSVAGQTIIKNISQEAAKNAVKVKAGDNVTVEDKEDAEGNITYTVKVEKGTVANGSSGFVTGGQMFTELRPTDGTYVKNLNSTAQNLSSLDAAVVKNTSTIAQHTQTIEKLQKMETITEQGETVIKELAQNAVKVQSDNEYVTVAGKKDADGNMVYTVSAKIGDFSAGGDANGLATVKDVKTAIQNVAGTTETQLAGKVNLDATNIGNNLKGADGTSGATEAEIKANKDAWGSALGGEVASGSTQLVTGDTVYNYVQKNSVSGTEGQKIIKETVKNAIDIKGSKNVSVEMGYDETSGKTTYTIYTAGGGSGGGTSIVDYDASLKQLSTDFGKEFETKGEGSTAYGYDSNAKGEDSVAFGKGAVTEGKNSIAVGAGTSTTADNAIAIGANGKAGENATAIGNNAQATGKNSIAVGADSVASSENEVSFGHKADDINPTTGEKYGSDVTRTLTNIKAGTGVNDAATYGQVQEVEKRVDTVAEAVNTIGNQMSNMEENLGKGVAGAAALAALQPMEFNPDDKLSFSAGFGHYKSQSAFALGAFYRPSETLLFSLGGAIGNGEDVINAGVSFSLGKGTKGATRLSNTQMTKQIQKLQQENANLLERVSRLENFLQKVAEAGGRRLQQDETVAQPIPTV